MAVKSIVNIVYHLLLAANVLVATGMLVTGYAHLVDPVKFHLLANADMLFPVFLVINAIFMFFWLLIDKKSSLLSLLTFVVCYSPMKTYMGINLPEDVPSDAIKVMSYNVYAFHSQPGDNDEGMKEKMIDYLVNADCDILCLQEANESLLSDELKKKMSAKYPYFQCNVKNAQSTALMIYTKYKILSSDTLAYESKGNMSVHYVLRTPRGKLLVINNHLETSHLSLDDRNNFKNIVTGEVNKDSVGKDSKNIISALMRSSLVRNAQAKAVSQFVNQHSDMPIVLCGDFNDTPTSFNHSVINRNLTDCYIATGIGPGWSYCHNGLRVRIDNIMCSQHFQPYGCKVLSDVPYSDHYPIVCWLKPKD